MDSTPLLEVDALKVALPSARGMAEALRGIAFTIARGETLGHAASAGQGHFQGVDLEQQRGIHRCAGRRWRRCRGWVETIVRCVAHPPNRG